MTEPIDAETLCFLDVIEYVRADTDASESCRDAVRDSYNGNSGAPVREAICRMTDYVRLTSCNRVQAIFLCLHSNDCQLNTVCGYRWQDCRNRIKHDTAQNMAVVAIVALVRDHSLTLAR